MHGHATCIFHVFSGIAGFWFERTLSVLGVRMLSSAMCAVVAKGRRLGYDSFGESEPRGLDDLAAVLLITWKLNLSNTTGLHFNLPCVETHEIVDMRTITLGVPPQEVHTLSTLALLRTAASAATLAGAVVHEFTRPAPSGSRWPTRRPAAIHVHVHVVVVKVARHCVNFVIQPCQAAPFTAISTVENLQVDVYSLCRYIPRNLSGIILIQTTNQ